MFWDIFNELCIKNNEKPTIAAKAMNISSATVTKWKNGAIPGGSTIIKLADYFGVSTDYLLTGKDSTSENNALSDNENKLLYLFKELNNEGQQKLIDYCDDLVTSNKYSCDNKALRLYDDEYITEVVARGDSKKKVKIKKSDIEKDLANYTPPDEL
ncbi:MAG: helix-turn-helix transcriptional regulator [Clostridia bacterium]|nr:helix-turn-helix transcriptional regulator [Clostridia bacterium]